MACKRRPLFRGDLFLCLGVLLSAGFPVDGRSWVRNRMKPVMRCNFPVALPWIKAKRLPTRKGAAWQKPAAKECCVQRSLP